MTGVSAQVLSHVVRRGVSGQAYHHPEGNDVHLNSFAIACVVLVAISTILALVSLEYTVGNLIAKLAMLESTTTTTIIESRPPAYSDEPDAPLEKKPLVEEADVEIVMIKHKPITSSVKNTIMHLHRVGGFAGRWRGLRENMVYHFLINMVSHFLSGVLFRGQNHIMARGLGFFISTLILCRFRMVWTHAMVAAPSNKPWYRRYCSRKNARVLLLPTLVYILALQANVVAPAALWYGLGVFDLADPELLRSLDNTAVACAIARVLSGPLLALGMFMFVTIPANATLTRIEACLLPEEEQTIVPFDRLAIMGELDLTVKGAPGKLLASAWKTVSYGTCFRVMGVYTKMILFMTTIVLLNSMAAFAILHAFNPDQMRVLYNGLF